MNPSLRHILQFFIHFGPFGLMLVTIADDSFLFLPIGGDLLMVLLVARNHGALFVCVVAATAGSTIGVFLLDLVCRKGGEAGLNRVVKPRLHNYLKGKMAHNAAIALVVSSLAPPPFPFGATIAVASALQYPRPRLLGVVFVSRFARFALVGWAAIHFGRRILRIASSPEFLWCMAGFIVFCLVGSTVSVIQWIRRGK